MTPPPAGATGAPPAPEPPVEERPPGFRRDRRHRKIGGVCAGLGLHYGLDPLIFRICLVVLSATGGIGLLFYGFAWLLVPYEGEEENEARRLLSGRVDGPALTAVLFALVGCGLLLSVINNGKLLWFAVLLGLLLAGAARWSRARPEQGESAQEGMPPEPKAPPVPDGPESWWRGPILKDGTHEGSTGYLWGPAVLGDDTGGATSTRARTPGRRPADTLSGRPRRPRSLGFLTFLLAGAAGTLTALADWDTQPLGPALQTGLAVALGVLGLGIAVSAFLGRTGLGTVFLAVLTAVALAGAANLPADATTGWSSPTWRPADTAALRPDYRIGTGDATLDLSEVTVPKGERASVRARVATGHLRVLLPRTTTVDVRADSGVGTVHLPGDRTDGFTVGNDVSRKATYRAPEGGLLTVHVETGFGLTEVIRATP
ncbi:PspC domain-containing protein [Streptomyces albidoflavus]|uniref:PspC domain-containing protein n=1 Tax=Streptomyces TaxID=1883 RepID=UPI0001AEE7EA|nr:PspC domain-containing protein [Streptomyces albidoflavus]BDH52927.1 membrane protein [Streptomyces albus]AGI90164.1 Integral membrane protein [Streptomyces albidoflavus]QLP94017.1 Integral membrane protein [Streptomyces albidoflavus]WAE12352.1 Integral membrane protein [Streptomyces albidoflavus]WAE17992.1 Integral membrane protein [Streptomyces albidoflavus]